MKIIFLIIIIIIIIIVIIIINITIIMIIIIISIRNSEVDNGGRVLHKAFTKTKFWAKTNFPAQIIKLYLYSYLFFINNLKKMSSGGNKKTINNTPNKNFKENSSATVPSPWKKLKKCWRKSLNHSRKKKLISSQQWAFKQEHKWTKW